jgi:hypothetical protein
LGDQEREAEARLEDFESSPHTSPLAPLRLGGRDKLQAIDNPCPPLLSIRHSTSSRMLNKPVVFTIDDQFIVDVGSEGH